MRFSQEMYNNQMMDNALISARERKYYDFPIVDSDAHHLDVLTELTEWFDEPWRSSVRNTEHFFMIPRDMGCRYVGGRLRRAKYKRPVGEVLPEIVWWFKETQKKMGIDYSIIFPGDLLSLGLHPQEDFEVAAARAYARWMTECVLPHDKTLRTMLYLPFNSPEASYELVNKYAGTPGVAGFMVTCVRHSQGYKNDYMKIYATLEERGIPIGFHTLDHWRERPSELFDSFLACHTIGFPFYNTMQLINVVMNGIPERFPKLKIIFFEAGVAWLPFVMNRLDLAYSMRPSEAPLLKRKPSEYIKDFSFTSQPIEWPDKMEELEQIFDIIDGKNTLLYASDLPHWDFDLPSSIYDLPFLKEEDKRAILGGNAMKLFGFEAPQHPQPTRG